MQDCDVLIVGAGSAGCVLAARLSERPEVRVMLVEAGGFPTDPDIADPRKWPLIQGRDYDWAYLTTPQKGTAGRVHPWPRGRVVGGSSCLHAMAHVRGHPEDFAPWAEAAGSRRWSYEGLLPAFIRSERFSGPPHPRHGRDGPLPVWLPGEEVSPLVRAYMAGGAALGAPIIGDHNLGPLCGVAPNSLTIRDGRRASAADAYLTPAVLARPNLTVRTGARVHRLTVDRGRVRGIEAERDGAVEPIRAARTIVAAGAVASPLLFMRSGIGPADTLAEAGIATIVDLPEVGRNLHDHLLTAGTVYATRRDVPPTRLQHSESLMYLDADDPSRGDGAPDVTLACVVVPAVSEEFTPPPFGRSFSILSGVAHPTSRGCIAPTGPDLDDPPLIDPAYLRTERDRRLARRALALARAVGASAPMADWVESEVLPGADKSGDAALDAFIARAAITHHHPVGTCALGQVVDADLAVIGLDDLFVVDASVIPAITSGPVHASVLAIAETFAAEVASRFT